MGQDVLSHPEEREPASPTLFCVISPLVPRTVLSPVISSFTFVICIPLIPVESSNSRKGKLMNGSSFGSTDRSLMEKLLPQGNLCAMIYLVCNRDLNNRSRTVYSIKKFLSCQPLSLLSHRQPCN